MIQLIDKSEKFLRIQPFTKQGIFLKRKGDRYILVGKTKDYASKLERAGFRFNTEIRAWLRPGRKPNVYIYTIVGDALGIPVDMRKYKHLIGTERKRKIGNFRPDRSVMAMYAGEMLDMINHIKTKFNERVMPILKRTENQYKIGGNGGAGYLRELTNMIDQVRGEYNFKRAAQTIAENVVKKSNKVNRQRFINYVKEASGLDLTTQI